MQRNRKLMAVMLSVALALTALLGGLNGATASAATKTGVKLSKKSITLNPGKNITLKVKKTNVKKIVSIKWSTNKKKVATVSKKGVVKGVKAGSAKITAKVKYQPKQSNKTVVKKLVCKVKVDAKATEAVKPTSASVPSNQPTTAPSSQPTVASSNQPTVAPSSQPTTAPSNQPTLAPSAQPTDTPVPPSASMTAAELMENMNQGWNLANTFESCGIIGGSKTDDFETGWGAPRTTKKMIQGVKACGFDSIRIPVAWSNMMEVKDGEYIVSQKYLKRVATVVDWCIEEDMYVVLNEHYDGAWWGMFGSSDMAIRERGMKKYEAIWTQVADYFKDYDYHLIFESANEELGDGVNTDNKGLNTALDAEGNYDPKGTVGVLTKDEVFTEVAKINQKFVDIVRASGGNNPYRQLLIAGYSTSLWDTCDDRFIMPTDTEENGKNKLSVSVHYYHQAGYCILEDKTQDWYIDSWGSEEDIADMHLQLDNLKKFTDQGYGVIIGEYGPQGMSKKGIPAFIRELMIYCEENNYAPMLWNNSIYNRTEQAIAYEDVWEVLKEVTGKQDIPLEEGAEKTGTLSSSVISEEEADVKVVATWEGKWSRTNNKSQNVNGECIRGEDEVGQFETTSNEGGIEIESNAWWWQLFFTYDWSKIENLPGVRITMAKQGVSALADFQLGYCKEVDAPGITLVDYTHSDYVEHYMTLSKNKLAVKPYVVMSSGTEGATITKIEILDVKLKEQ